MNRFLPTTYYAPPTAFPKRTSTFIRCQEARS